MCASKNNKSINISLYHESTQIKNATFYFGNILTEEYTDSNITNLKLLNQVYITAPIKLKSVFGNNLAQTKVGNVLIALLTSFNSEIVPNSTLVNTLYLCLSCLWNGTDCSENMGAKLLELDKFKDTICASFKKCDFFSSVDKQLASSMISIIHNILRRPKLRDSFKGTGIEHRIVELARCSDELSIKVVCLVVLLEIATKNQIQQYLDLYKSIEGVVVCFLDSASNNEYYRGEGFSGTELLDMIKSLSRVDYLKESFAKSNTFRSTLIRLLSQNYKIDLVVEVIKTVYDANEIKGILDLYKTKNKDHNTVVLDSLCKITFS